MPEYKTLRKQNFSSQIYSLVPIRYEDRYLIMKWRNDQMYHLRQNTPLTEDQQDLYFDTVVAGLFEQEKPNQILFSYLVHEDCIGYGGLVHIDWFNKSAELSFIMNTELENVMFEKMWFIFLKLIEQVAYDELNLSVIFTYTFDLRPKLFKILNVADFKEDRTIKNVVKSDKTMEVVIHSKKTLKFNRVNE